MEGPGTDVDPTWNLEAWGPAKEDPTEKVLGLVASPSRPQARALRALAHLAKGEYFP